MKEKVAEIMTRDVITVQETDSVLEVAQVFRTKKVAGAPVLNERAELVGVVSEADILKLLDTYRWYTPILTTLELLQLHQKEPRDIQQDIEKAGATQIREIMSKDPETVSPDTVIDDAAQIMYLTGFNRLPVLDESGALVGIVTRADILASLYEQLEGE
ncbi:MAG TPA: CBS domain-containing protein [Methanomicrobia archaeon]|nr:CBS domain-containing protein [Methanomicrobia archaeon]